MDSLYFFGPIADIAPTAVDFLESSDKAARKSQRAVRKSGGLLYSLGTIFLKDGGGCHLSDKMKLAFAEKLIYIHVLCPVMPA